MKKNRSLMISIFITAFLVVIGGGVATTVLANNQTTQGNKISAADAVKTYQAREAEWQALLEKANHDLDQANQQLTAMAGSSTGESTPESSSSQYPVSEEMAKSIAFQVAKDYPLSDPELVNYNGTVAYEVKFKNGTIYVDATSGQILFNGLSVSQATSITAEEAVKLAVAYLGNSNVADIEISSYNGSKVYAVKFTNGQQIYVSLSGQIVAVQLPSSTSTPPTHEYEHEDENEHSSYEEGEH
jgi:uncharacterized membrane protein YkoI